MSSIRTKKVESLLQKELGEIFQKHYQNHGMVTVTEVSITPDLFIAKVYLSFLVTGLDAQAAFEQLLHHEQDVRYRLSQKIRHQLRKMPELHFIFDDRTRHSIHMEELFNSIEIPKDAKTDSSTDELK